MIGKIPKLAIIGLIVLLIGFSPEILATVNVDTTPPAIIATYPGGTLTAPTPLTLNSTITITLATDSADVDPTKTTCIINNPSIEPPGITVGLVPDPSKQGHFSAPYTILYEGRYTFSFYLWDYAGNKKLLDRYGEVGDAAGDFYMRDGNDADYIRVTKDSTITFNHLTLYFKFRATNHGADITRVWIDVVGKSTFDLTETVADSEWDGTTWTAPSDGTYTINGYFNAFGREFKGLSILVGANEEPSPPSEWSTYDWLKIIGGALIVVGLIVKK